MPELPRNPTSRIRHRFVRWSLLGVFDGIFVALTTGEKTRADHDRRDASESPPYRLPAVEGY
jgi:hypothetical protein